MSDTVLLIKHSPRERADRVARLLAERGYALERCNAAAGEELPPPSPRYACAVIYGGPQSVNDAETRAHIRHEIEWIDRWLAHERPLLCICLGAQLLARALGARVARHESGMCEIGFTRIEPTPEASDFLSRPLHVYQWHSEGFDLPAGAALLATGGRFPNQAFRYGRHAYGLQFHPEVTPGIMRQWWSEAGLSALDTPGAHSRSRQHSDSRRFDAAVEAWFERFLDGWRAEWRQSARAAGPAPCAPDHRVCDHGRASHPDEPAA